MGDEGGFCDDYRKWKLVELTVRLREIVRQESRLPLSFKNKWNSFHDKSPFLAKSHSRDREQAMA